MSDAVSNHRFGKAWRERVDLVAVAKGHRFLTRSLVCLVILGPTAGFLWGMYFANSVGGNPPQYQSILASLFTFGFAGSVIASIAGLITLSLALRTSVPVIGFLIVLLFVPLLGVIAACLQCSVASQALRDSGVRAGWLGVSRHDMAKLLLGTCPRCGYDVRMLPGKQCPECGGEVG